jgi:hypothetical protein
MADVGVVLQRMLDPRWETVVGTLREWTDLEYLRGPMPMGPPGRSPGAGGMGVSFSIIAVGPAGGGADPAHPPTESEGWKRMWLRRDGRYRVEHRTPGIAEPWLTEIVGPEATHVVRGDGTVTRSDPPLLTRFSTWMVDPGSILGIVRLAFGAEDTFAGRPVVHATATMRLELPPMAMSAGPVMYGMPIGGRSELTIDVESGVVVRFATFEGARLVGVRQFVDLAVDEEVDDELVTFRLAPGQKLRGPNHDMLDLLRSRGEDVSDIDPDDAEAVQAAMRRSHERDRGARVGFPSQPVSPPPKATTVAPLGRPPADEEGARSAIAEAVAGLSPADPEPRARWIERGDLLDEPFALSRDRAESITRDQPVTMELADVAFLREDEALFDFVIRFGPAEFRREGRAVFRDGRWLVSYDTAAALLGLGGVAAPSLLDHPEEGP